jgi:hypothetical protein
MSTGLGLQTFDDGSTLQTFDDGSTLAVGTDGSVSSTTIGPEADGDPSPQPAGEPEAPTSNGDIDVFAGLAGTDPTAPTSESSQIIAQDD